MMPRRFWILTGWVIGLATLATASAVVEDTFEDMYDLAGCAPPAPAPDYEACAGFRFQAGAAQVAGALFKVPAIGLALVAASIGIGARRPASPDRRAHADGEASKPRMQRPRGSGGPAPEGKRVTRAAARKALAAADPDAKTPPASKRRSKAPSKALMQDAPASTAP